MTDRESEEVANPERRRMLSRFALGGTALAGGMAGGVAAAAIGGGRPRKERVTLDVACIGDTWRHAEPINPADDADFRVAFLVEGWIYPQGTVPEAGFVPTSDGSIGRWFCRGWQILDGNRPEPHAVTIQEYVLGSISRDRLFPPDNLTSSGLEGTFGAETGTRSVIGGTGRYLGATGQVRQTNNGVNTSVFADGSGDPAPNFVFEFDLFLPES